MKPLLAAILLTAGTNLFAGTPEQDTAKLVGRWKGTCTGESERNPNHVFTGIIDFVVAANGRSVKMLRCPLLPGKYEGTSFTAKVKADGSITWSFPWLDEPAKDTTNIVARLTANRNSADFYGSTGVVDRHNDGSFALKTISLKATLTKDE